MTKHSWIFIVEKLKKIMAQKYEYGLYILARQTSTDLLKSVEVTFIGLMHSNTLDSFEKIYMSLLYWFLIV